MATKFKLSTVNEVICYIYVMFFELATNEVFKFLFLGEVFIFDIL
jgi:hypothetical protein